MLCTCGDMTHCAFLCKKKSGGFNHIFSADLIPFQGCGIFLGSYADALSIYNKLPILNFNFPIESAVNSVVFKHISNILHFEEVVDSNYFYIIPLQGSPERQPADPAKTVNTYFNF